MEKMTKKMYEKPAAKDFRKMAAEQNGPEGLFVQGCAIQMLCTTGYCAPTYATPS